MFVSMPGKEWRLLEWGMDAISDRVGNDAISHIQDEKVLEDKKQHVSGKSR